MKTCLSSALLYLRHRVFPQLAAAVLALPLTLAAQTAEPLPTPSARLDQLDATYSSTLRKYHAPVIQDYLRDLEKLRQTLVTQGRADDAKQVQAEIAKTLKLPGTTGLLSYDPLKPAPEPAEPASEKPPAGKGSRRFSPDAITLSIANAVNPSPPVDALQEHPDAKALPIGHAEWQVAKIPPGTYEVMLVCSIIGSPEKVSVQATLGSFTAERKVPPPFPGSSLNDFRVLRVGTFTLDQELTGTALTLESTDPTHPCMWVRNVILTHPKPAPGEGPRRKGPLREGPEKVGKSPPPNGPAPSSTPPAPAQ